MANKYEGEIDIVLYHKKYKLKIDMHVVGEFQSETDADFMQVMVKALNAFQESNGIEESLKRAQVMSSAVRMDHAAWLFYIAAKRADKTVTFEEIQEAVLLEGAIERVDEIYEVGGQAYKENGQMFTSEDENSEKSAQLVRSYPLVFVEVATFATMGVIDTVKKTF